MAKKPNARRRSRNILQVIWDWFLAPRRSSRFATQSKAKSKRGRKTGNARDAQLRQQGSGSSHRPLPKRDTANATLSAIASVDRKGKVRFHDSDRVLFVSAKGSKSTALMEARAHFSAMGQREADCTKQLAEHGATTDVIQAINALKSEFKTQPGLADSAAQLASQEQVIETLADALQRVLDQNRDARLNIITTLEASKSAALDQLDQALTIARLDWTQAGTIESIHLEPLNRRFGNAQDAVSRRLADAQNSPDTILEKRSELLDAYAELMAEEASSGQLPKALDKLAAIWITTNGLESIADLADHTVERYGRQQRNQRDAHKTLRDLAQQLEAEMQAAAEHGRQQLVDLTKKLDQLARQDSPIQGRRLAELDRQAQDAFAQINRANVSADRASIMHTQSQLAAAFRTLEAQDIRRTREREDALDQAKALLSSIEGLQPDPMVERRWAHWEEQHHSLRAQFDQALKALPARTKSTLLDQLNSHTQAWGQSRNQFFEGLDAGRDAADARKSALVDKLMHYPDGLDARQLDALLQQSMDEWKNVGPAPREREEELWQSYLEVRQAVAAERDSIREAEHGERLESMSAAFIRKKSRLNWLEWLANHDRYLARQKDNTLKAKDWAAKDREINKLRAQLFDIQRKLNRVSPLQTKAALAKKSKENEL